MTTSGRRRLVFSDINRCFTDCDRNSTDLIVLSPKAHAWLVTSYHHYFSKTANQTKTSDTFANNLETQLRCHISAKTKLRKS